MTDLLKDSGEPSELSDCHCEPVPSRRGNRFIDEIAPAPFDKLRALRNHT